MKNPSGSAAIDWPSVGLVVGISFVAGVLAGLCCLEVVSGTAIWVRGLLGAVIGASAGIIGGLMFFFLYEGFTQGFKHPLALLLWTLGYELPTALCSSPFGATGGAITLLLVG